MKESTIQKIICEYLSANGYFYFSIPNEGIMTALKIFNIPDVISYKIITHFKKMGIVPGMPDLAVIIHPVLARKSEIVFFEIKNENGKVNKNQKKIHQILIKKGFKIFVVRSVEDVQFVLKQCEGNLSDKRPDPTPSPPEKKY